ncbi:MAG: sigma-54-dependent Fis family transcriptional regulator [Proteobacteria bacterium]|nr:MAG: sigma-54-dependent Fis family transcriptional regulator [Pseudomonadota bacterium]QKK12230.1 MAG: sigma-54-dependent Fis family transcriptional regulator [Pseudomonadota bacterium]
MNRILIVEDEKVIRQALLRLLERNGYEVADAGSVAEAVENHDLTSFDLVIADLRLPGTPGTDIIAHCENTPVVIMTSYASVRSAVDSMQLGAADYIAKPFDHDEMLLLVERLLQQNRMARQNIALKSDLERNYPVSGLVGECPPMKEVFNRISKVAPTDTTVLILGESGTGKELVARALHETSPRKDGPIITVNCAAIPESLIESELFGHEKGAFTGAVGIRHGLVEAADGGTLFLDEIGELPLTAQGRLLRVLQEGEIRRIGSPHERKVDVRLVAATHRDLQQQVKTGEFREDLYFRLRVMEIHLPPLRERGEDVAQLAEFLLEKSCRRLNRAPLQFTPASMETLLKYPWPGNVREMENAIERAVILSDGHSITPEMLSIEPARLPDKNAEVSPSTDLDLSLEDYFRRFVLEHQDELTETALAKRLGISRKALWEKRQRLGIPRRK